MVDPERAKAPATNEPTTQPTDELERLRRLLLGREQRHLRDLQRRFDELKLTAEEVAGVLPEAIARRATEDKQLARALAPTIESGIAESVHHNPGPVADAIYPTLGPAIRKAIAETMAGFVETLNRAIEHSFSIRGLKWRIEAWRTGVPYSEIVIRHALVYQIEQIFLIHTETGLLLTHACIDPAKARDADLVSGMLTAIRDFVADSFDVSTSDGLRTFSVGERSVVVEAGPRALLAAVVKGQPPSDLWERLQETLERLHLQLRGPLEDFDGDSAPFASALPLIEGCLETVVETDRPTSRSRAPLFAWLAAGIIVLGLLAFAYTSHRRWRQALDSLRDEPGLVVLQAERNWGKWNISGLRDPLATDPTALLTAGGAKTSDLRMHWRPYLSLESAISLRRAEERMSPPPTVSLGLDGGRLTARGNAPPRWIESARLAALTIPGIEEIDLSDVERSVSPELEQRRLLLQEQRVLFDVGSATIADDSQRVLEAAASTLRELADLAREEGWGVALEVTGRTDSSGTEQLNLVLSDQRARAVRVALEELGLVIERLTLVASGVSDPLVAENPAEQAQLNRSVSFTIRLIERGL